MASVSALPLWEFQFDGSFKSSKTCRSGAGAVLWYTPAGSLPTSPHLSRDENEDNLCASEATGPEEDDNVSGPNEPAPIASPHPDEDSHSSLSEDEDSRDSGESQPSAAKVSSLESRGMIPKMKWTKEEELEQLINDLKSKMNQDFDNLSKEVSD